MAHRLAFLLGAALLVAAGGSWGDGIEPFRVSQAHGRLPEIRAYLQLPSAGSDPATGQLRASLGETELKLVRTEPFSESNEGVAYIFLVDVSRSLTAAEFTEIRSALGVWIGELRDVDRAALVSFGDDCVVFQDFTNERAALQARLAELGPKDGTTQLHLAIERALDLASRADAELPARRVIVVLSDGKDEGSGLTVDDVLQRQRETQVPIYAAGYSHLRNDERRRYLDVLHRLALASGGAYREATGQAIEATYHDLSSAVRNVVVSTWTCSGCVADGSSKRLQVHYEKGTRSLTDGVELRLLPDLAQLPDAAPDAPQGTAGNSSPLWERLEVQTLAGAVTVLALLAVLFARRRRSRRAEAAAQPAGSDAGPQPTQSCDAEPTPSTSTGSAPGRQLTIVFLDEEGGKASQQKLQIVERLLIGRDASADISLSEDEETSHEHCELTFSGHRLVVRDLESRNGTWVNGIVLPRGGAQHLEARDELRVGATRLRVLLDEA